MRNERTQNYSLPGHEACAAIERKPLDDFVGCLAVGRGRFERELERVRALAWFAVVIEVSMKDVTWHRYTSRMEPQAALQSVLTFQARYGCAFVPVDPRRGGEYVTFWALQEYAQEVEARGKEAQAVGELDDMGK